MTSRIIATGSYLPDNIVTNEFLSTLVDTSDEWISSRTGIKTRTISSGEGTTQMATAAAFKALKNANISAEELDYIIVATISADRCMPSTACEVQSNIGATNAACFDLASACSGFVYGLQVANSLLQTTNTLRALVIGAETLSKLIDWEDRSTCVLFGDGAGAAIIEKNENGIIDTILGSDGDKGYALTCDIRAIKNPFIQIEGAYISEDQSNSNSSCNSLSDEFIRMDGQEVYKFAVTKVTETIQAILKRNQLLQDEIDYFILHQANERIIQAVAKRLKVDLSRFPMNLQQYGNTSAATIPILLDELNRTKHLEPGDKIILSGFGGGLTWGTMLLTW